VQGTKLSGMTDPDGNKNLHNWAGDVWMKPLSDGSFAVVLINRDPLHAHPLRVGFGQGNTMLFPAGPFAKMLVRDVHARADLGVYALQVEVEVRSGRWELGLEGLNCCGGGAVFNSHGRCCRSMRGFCC
jgi:hypothetical protein